MEELDLLKKHWNNQPEFEKKSKEELHKITQKSSSSILKWVIFANIIELSILIIIGFFWGNQTVETHEFSEIVNITDYILFSVPIVFSLIYIFLIRKISITDNIAELTQNILNARKILNLYIYINLSIFALISLIGIIISIKTSTIDQTHNTYIVYFSYIISLILVLLIFVGTPLLLYKLVYGKFVKRLTKNYNDLNS